MTTRAKGRAETRRESQPPSKRGTEENCRPRAVLEAWQASGRFCLARLQGDVDESQPTTEANQAKSLGLVAGRGSIANALTPRDTCHLETLTLETLAPPRQCRALAQKPRLPVSFAVPMPPGRPRLKVGFPGPALGDSAVILTAVPALKRGHVSARAPQAQPLAQPELRIR